MSKNINDKMTFGKYNGMTVKEAIDNYYYGMNMIVGKYPDWYGESVHEYLTEVSSAIGRNKNLKGQMNKRIKMENT